MLTRLWDTWHCSAGEWTVWAPDAQSRRAMDTAPDRGVHASYIQADHLRSGVDAEAGVQRKVLTRFVIHEVFDAAVMQTVVTDFIRAHDTFHTAFPVSDDPRPRGRTVTPDEITMGVAATSDTHPRSTLKDYLHDNVPGLHDWAAFAVGVSGTEHARPDSERPRFEVSVAVDHLYTDALSFVLSFFEITSRYAAARGGRHFAVPASRPYAEFTAAQRALGQSLTLDHPAVAQWREVIDRARGMPRFPLPLGLAPGETAPSVFAAHTAFVTPDQATRFGLAAKAAGASTSSALLALMGEIHRRLTGGELFTILVPRADRSNPEDTFSVGWFVTRVPVQFTVSDSFDQTAHDAHTALERSKALDGTPVYPVIDLLAEDPSFPVDRDFSAPMMSYIDVTRLPGAEFARDHELSAFMYSAPTNEVYIWINRDEQGLDFNATRPDTVEAELAVDVVFELLRDRVVEIADRSLAGVVS